MTQLLQEVLERVEHLPPGEQDAIAAQIAALLDDDREWDKLFAAKKDVIGRMAQEALAEAHRGKTVPLEAVLDEV
jgi:hypothetical protein